MPHPAVPELAAHCALLLLDGTVLQDT